MGGSVVGRSVGEISGASIIVTHVREDPTSLSIGPGGVLEESEPLLSSPMKLLKEDIQS